jgi:hypothetical protein
MDMSRETFRRAALLSAACLLLSGCESLAVTALGLGASQAMGHTLSGISYRTFTAPITKVKNASVGALKHMGMTLDSASKTETGELILARAGRREVQIEIESLTSNATRVRVTARDGGLFYDSSTATEIIVQTEKLLTSETRQARKA